MGWRRFVGYRMLSDYDVALYFWRGAAAGSRGAGARSGFRDRSLVFRDLGISFRAIDVYVPYTRRILSNDAFSRLGGTGGKLNSVGLAPLTAGQNLHWGGDAVRGHNRG